MSLQQKIDYSINLLRRAEPMALPRESWEVIGNIHENPELLNNH